ncbi:MAG: rhomboid family intramembrane serine protease [Streptococcaceae bacterium]|nr:rhomboid family intramembrane serine protease [Streptococcaceae bacterium]
MVFHNEWWRLFTPIFIHIGWEHFIFNSLTLYFIGRQIESLFGPLRFFFLYLLSGLVGNIISFAMNNGVDSSVSAGASTSLFGLFAAFGALRFFFKDNRIIVQLANQYFIFIAINLAFNLFESSVDMSGHVGGLIGGFLLSIILGIPFQMDHFPKSKRLLALLAITAISAASIVFGISKF